MDSMIWSLVDYLEFPTVRPCDPSEQKRLKALGSVDHWLHDYA